MDKKKMTLVIVGTLLAMALVAAILVLWLVPGRNTDAPAGTITGSVSDVQSGEQTGSETPDATENDSNEPTVGVEVEAPNTGDNGGSTGNTGNGGSGNSGNGGNQGGNNEIDFDDLLGNS